MNPHIEHRVRERAYRIWLDEGMPEGRAALHWEMASELEATESPQPPGADEIARKPRKPSAAKQASPAAKRTSAPAKAASDAAATKRAKKTAS